ncbi:MAG TPA: YbaK/EbsC family protein [Candidatus Saccharimonadales bacterium]|jgi:Ala-tRNA(Pro) deacylase|nr:YbaK/EbsC family protein [Candidatus Saccharimonadales bacterium]
MNPYDAIIKLLKDNLINFEVLEHEPVFTSEQAAKVRGLSLDSGAKSLLLKADKNFILVVLPGSRKIDSKKLKTKLGVKNLHFASPEDVELFMHCKIGACYPFGSVTKLDTYIDESLLDQASISFNPGVHTKSIKMDLADYLKIENPKRIDATQN